MVLKYIQGFVADAVDRGLGGNPLKVPSPGDCFGCQFGSLIGEQPIGVDHLFLHFEEKYYVPSLLSKAIKSGGYKFPDVIWASLDSDLKRGDDKLLKDILRAYFRKLKPKLLESMYGHGVYLKSLAVK